MKIKPCLLKHFITKGTVEYILGLVFVTVVSHLPSQSSYPVWEDFITKAGKLQSQLRSVFCVYIINTMLTTHISILR